LADEKKKRKEGEREVGRQEFGLSGQEEEVGRASCLATGWKELG
jgi:hypothetical protein